MNNKLTLIPLFALALVIGISAQKTPAKPWSEWTEKEATKVLDKSGWGQVQVETDTTQMTYSPASRGNQGATNQAVDTNYHIRFLSAKPIREATARMILLKQGSPNEQLTKSVTGFVDRAFDDLIVVAVTYDSKDGRYSGAALESFNAATLAVLKNSTYIEDKGGKKIFLADYKPPINDGLGAKFIFPKKVDGEPLVRTNSTELHFYAEVPTSVRIAPNSTNPNAFSSFIKLSMRFKVADMMDGGKVEY